MYKEFCAENSHLAKHMEKINKTTIMADKDDVQSIISFDDKYGVQIFCLCSKLINIVTRLSPTEPNVEKILDALVLGKKRSKKL